MKTKSLILGVGAAGALLSAPAVMAQSAVSDPVGFLTVNVEGANAGNPSLSLISPTLLAAPEFSGALSGVAGNVLTVDGALTPGAFTTGGTYYVEITGGNGDSGVFADITANDASTITLAEALDTAVAGTIVTVRRHITLNDFLGSDNSAGLQAGNNIGEADNVTILNSTTGGSVTYFFVTGLGWVDSTFGASGDVIIGPEQGLIVLRRAETDASFTSVGHVKVNEASLPILEGLNVVGVPNAVGTTLDDSTLGVTLAPGNNIGEADNVTVFVDGVATSYFFVTGLGWVDSAFGASGDVALAEGSAILVNRRASAGTEWSAPAPVIN